MTPWVPIQDAADVLARPVRVVRSWVHHLQVRSICDRETGDTLVHWLDCQRMDKARPKEQPVTAKLAIAYLDSHGARGINAAMLRTWAWRGHIARIGTDPHGYALYDLRTITRHAVRRGLLAPDHTYCDDDPCSRMPETG